MEGKGGRWGNGSVWLWVQVRGGGGAALMGWFVFCRFRYTLELFLTGEKVQQLGTDGPETLQAWASAIGKVSQPQPRHPVPLVGPWALSLLPCSDSSQHSMLFILHGKHEGIAGAPVLPGDLPPSSWGSALGGRALP